MKNIKNLYKKNGKWWLSVEFNKNASGKKKFSKVLELLENAERRYDLILDNKIVLARAIFKQNTDLLSLSQLITIIEGWKGSAVYVCGYKIKLTHFYALSKMLECSATKAPCRIKNREKKLAFLGCHMKKFRVGLLNYSPGLSGNDKYWFTFFKKEENSSCRFNIDLDALIEAVWLSQCCPLFPNTFFDSLERLPSTVNLYDSDIWAPAKDNIETRKLKIFPAIAPQSPEIYNQWIRGIIL